jgi:hypothetical protein
MGVLKTLVQELANESDEITQRYIVVAIYRIIASENGLHSGNSNRKTREDSLS